VGAIAQANYIQRSEERATKKLKIFPFFFLGDVQKEKKQEGMEWDEKRNMPLA